MIIGDAPDVELELLEQWPPIRLQLNERSKGRTLDVASYDKRGGLTSRRERGESVLCSVMKLVMLACLQPTSSPGPGSLTATLPRPSPCRDMTIGRLSIVYGCAVERVQRDGCGRKPTNVKYACGTIAEAAIIIIIVVVV